MDPVEFIKSVEAEDSGFKKTIESGKMLYTFQYKPIEYVVCKEMQGSDMSEDAFYKRVEELKNTVWFNISIQTSSKNINPLKNTNSVGEYNNRYQYFLTLAANDISLSYANKDADRIAYHFENNYGLTPMDVMIVGFRIPDKEPIQNIDLTYEDAYYKNGPLKVRIDKRTLNNKPNLVL